MAVVQIDEDVELKVGSPAPAPAARSGPTAGAIKRATGRLLTGRDLRGLSLKNLRIELEQHLGVPTGSLKPRNEELKAAVQAYMAQQSNAVPVDASAANQAAAAPIAKAPPVHATVAPQMVSQASSMAAAAASVAPRAESSRVMAMDVEDERGTKRPAEEEQVKAAKQKKPNKVTGNALYRKEVWMRITEELTAENGGVKPSMGKVISLVSERWKSLPAEEQKRYEAQAEEANAAANVGGDNLVQEPVSKRGRGGGRGRGRGRAAAPKPAQDAAEPSLTRAEFQKFSSAIKGAFTTLTSDGAVGSEIAQATLLPRAFKTGTVGWFYGKKIPIALEGGRSVMCQAQFSFMVNGSKSWQDGEGYNAEAFAVDPGASEVGACAEADMASPNVENRTALADATEDPGKEHTPEVATLTEVAPAQDAERQQAAVEAPQGNDIQTNAEGQQSAVEAPKADDIQTDEEVEAEQGTDIQTNTDGQEAAVEQDPVKQKASLEQGTTDDVSAE